MFFVFNLNESMLKENEFTYRKRDLLRSNTFDTGFNRMPFSISEP